MKTTIALTSLAALAHETRLGVFRFLVSVGPEGVPAGDIAGKLKIPAPTLSFHLKELERSGLIGAHRESRNIIYAADYDHMRALLSYLMEDCCRGRPEICCNPKNVAHERTEKYSVSVYRKFGALDFCGGIYKLEARAPFPGVQRG